MRELVLTLGGKRLAKTSSDLPNAQFLVGRICADFLGKLGSVENSPTARDFLMKAAREAGIQLIKKCAAVSGG